MRSIFVLLCLAAACGEEQAPAPEVISKPAVVETPSPPPVVPDFDSGDDEIAALRIIRSLPAWSAAIERYRYLARRGQSGPIHGLLATSKSGLRLVDETIGDGALSIPVVLPSETPAKPPMRVVLWGSWQLDKTQWRWHATRVERLEAPTTTKPEEPLTPLKHTAPDDITPASQASRRGGAISFVIIQRSEEVEDGWLIADDQEGEPIARLLLPGEVGTYGDQSSLSNDERWRLTTATRYWVRIGRFRPARSGELPVYDARSAPFR